MVRFYLYTEDMFNHRCGAIWDLLPGSLPSLMLIWCGAHWIESVYMPNVWVVLVSGFQFGGGVFTLKFCWHMVVLLQTFYWTECAFIHIIYYHCFLPAWYLVSYLAQFTFILDFICLSHFFCCLDAYIFRTFLTSAVFSPYNLVLNHYYYW